MVNDMDTEERQISKGVVHGTGHSADDGPGHRSVCGARFDLLGDSGWGISSLHEGKTLEFARVGKEYITAEFHVTRDELDDALRRLEEAHRAANA